MLILKNLEPLLQTRTTQSLSITKKNRVLYKPYPKQTLLHISTAEETLYGGAAGGGKSFAFIWDAYMFCIKHPGVRVAMFRRTYPELEKSLIFYSRMLFDKSMGKYNEQKKRWELWGPGGKKSYLEFAHCMDESDVFNYQSAQYDAMYFDELTHFSEFQYTYLLTRVRPNVPGVRPRIKCATNPGNIGHAWVRRRWRLYDQDLWYKIWQPEVEDGKIPGTRCFIQSKVTDNPFIITNDPKYIDRLKGSSHSKQLLDGDWEIFSGQAFAEWAPAIHMCKSFIIPNDWDRWVSMDYGYSKPFSAHWHAQDPVTKRIFTYRELYGTQIKESDQARRILGMSINPDSTTEKINYYVADPSCWGTRGGESSIAEVWANNGMSCIQGNRDRMAGKARVHDNLSMYDANRSWWQIFEDKCPNLCRTLPELVLDAKNTEDVNTTQEDHAYDDVRYFFMSRPSVSSIKLSKGNEYRQDIDGASKAEWDSFRKRILKMAQGNDGRDASHEINEVNA